MAIERALISVYDKTGIVEFAHELAALGVEIVSLEEPPGFSATPGFQCAMSPN